MPFTPLHLGPGLLMKAAAPSSFSLRSFAVVQLLIDAEVVANLALDRHPLHGVVHQLPAAAAIGVAVGVVAWASRVRLVPAIVGGVLGGVSHTLLDATMHADLAPWGRGNPLLVPGGLVLMSVLCGISLVAGTMALRWREVAPFGGQGS